MFKILVSPGESVLKVERVLFSPVDVALIIEFQDACEGMAISQTLPSPPPVLFAHVYVFVEGSGNQIKRAIVPIYNPRSKSVEVAVINPEPVGQKVCQQQTSNDRGRGPYVGTIVRKTMIHIIYVVV